MGKKTLPSLTCHRYSKDVNAKCKSSEEMKVTPTATLAASGVLTGSASESPGPWEPSRARRESLVRGRKAGRFVFRERGQRQTRCMAGKVKNRRQKLVGHSSGEARAGPGQKQARATRLGRARVVRWEKALKSCRWNGREQSGQSVTQCCQLSSEKGH